MKTTPTLPPRTVAGVCPFDAPSSCGALTVSLTTPPPAPHALHLPTSLSFFASSYNAENAQLTLSEMTPRTVTEFLPGW